MGKIKNRLIWELLQERERLDEAGKDIKEHNIVIRYLETGISTHNPDSYPLLNSAMFDYKTLVSDYCD